MGMSDKRLWVAGAVFWGFTEATVFFVVPDLLLTAAVIAVGVAMAFRLALAAAGAAVLGGVVMWGLGAGDTDAARALLLSVPLLGDDLVLRVKSEIAGVWPTNLMIGAISGAPYKIYAVEAGAAGIDPVLFAIVSFFARLARFALAISLFVAGLSMLRLIGSGRFVWGFFTLIWGTIYATYMFIRLNA